MKTLILEDENNIREILSIIVGDFTEDISFATNIKEAKDLVNKNQFDFAILDLRLPDGSGIEVLEEMRKNNQDTDVLIVTAFASSDTAVKAMKLGAYDYIPKPFNINDLRLKIRNVYEKHNLEKKLKEVQFSEIDNIIGESPAIQKVKKLIQKVAPYDTNILILGESGTGKEVTAKTIHKLSKRKEKPFVAINCASLPPDLLESELFGYEKGAFTGADTNKKGLIESANGGTLFLDEIGDMPYELQAKLLRFLEEMKIRPLGSTREINVDVRVIAATNKNLEKLINEGRFREDLYYRLSSIIIELPPLRERKEDIPRLAQHLLKQIIKKYGKEINRIDPEFINYLMQHEFKGNIRELKNILEKAVLLADDDVLRANLLIENKQPMLNLEIGEEGIDLKQVLNDIEKELLMKALEKTKGNKTKAAELLGLTFREFRYRLSKHINKNIN